jgi:hypothetical protein
VFENNWQNPLKWLSEEILLNIICIWKLYKFRIKPGWDIYHISLCGVWKILSIHVLFRKCIALQICAEIQSWGKEFCFDTSCRTHYGYKQSAHQCIQIPYSVYLIDLAWEFCLTLDDDSLHTHTKDSQSIFNIDRGKGTATVVNPMFRSNYSSVVRNSEVGGVLRKAYNKSI